MSSREIIEYVGGVEGYNDIIGDLYGVQGVDGGDGYGVGYDIGDVGDVGDYGVSGYNDIIGDIGDIAGLNDHEIGRRVRQSMQQRARAPQGRPPAARPPAARAPSPAAVRQALQQAAARGAQQAMQGQRRPHEVPGMVGAQQLRSVGESIARRQISPVPLTSVPANSTANATFRPQRPLRAERLVLDGAALGGLFVTDFLIGADPQFVNSGAVPASSFSPQAFNMELRGNTADPGIDITITFHNTTGAAIVVGGMLLGTSLTRA